MSFFITQLTGLSAREWEINLKILYDMSDKKIYLYRLCDTSYAIFKLISPKSKEAVIKRLQEKFIYGDFMYKELFEAMALQCVRLVKPSLELLTLDYVLNYSELI